MPCSSIAEDDVVIRYLRLGLTLGTLHSEFVDAYHGPAALRVEVESEPTTTAVALAASIERLIADLDSGAGSEVSDLRRRWIRAQLVGIATVAAKLDGADISYVEEVQRCYGVTPSRVDHDEVTAALDLLDAAVPGDGDLRERLAANRARHAIPPERLDAVIADVADELRSRTVAMFGLPDGETVRFELVSGQPWSGFNYYEGNLTSRVAINTDLPVLSSSIGHLVAHEAYPGHHTEHCLKEVGLVRALGHLEESIFLVGAPQCLLAEGLADLAIEIVLGDDATQVIGEIVRSHGVVHDDEAVAALGVFSEMSSRVRGHLGMMLHADGADERVVIDTAERWLLVDRARAEKSVEFMCDPTWRAYISCYVEGLPLCRSFVGGDPARFARLLNEQLIPADLN